jgi:hypothetical protein
MDNFERCEQEFISKTRFMFVVCHKNACARYYPCCLHLLAESDSLVFDWLENGGVVLSERGA